MTDAPLVCRLDAFNPADRRRHDALVEELRALRRGARELSTGFLFRFPGDTATFRLLVEWLTLERRCCPFLDFELVEDAEFPDEAILKVTGSRGWNAKEFLAAELLASPAPRSGNASVLEMRREKPRRGPRPSAR